MGNLNVRYVFDRESEEISSNPPLTKKIAVLFPPISLFRNTHWPDLSGARCCERLSINRTLQESIVSYVLADEYVQKMTFTITCSRQSCQERPEGSKVGL